MLNKLKELYANLIFGSLQNLNLITKIVALAYTILFILECLIYILTLGFIETCILLNIVRGGRPWCAFNPLISIIGRIHAILYTIGLLLERIIFVISFTLIDTMKISRSISELKIYEK